MFSKTTEYALRATLFIARESSQGKRPGIQQVADAIGSPVSFTAKILQVLTRNNALISSVRGPNGGFFISEKMRNRPLDTILKVTGEIDILNKCVLGLYECSEKNPCPLHHEYKGIKQQLKHLFNSRSIAEVADLTLAEDTVLKIIYRRKN